MESPEFSLDSILLENLTPQPVENPVRLGANQFLLMWLALKLDLRRHEYCNYDLPLLYRKITLEDQDLQTITALRELMMAQLEQLINASTPAMVSLCWLCANNGISPALFLSEKSNLIIMNHILLQQIVPPPDQLDGTTRWMIQEQAKSGNFPLFTNVLRVQDPLQNLTVFPPKRLSGFFLAQPKFPSDTHLEKLEIPLYVPDNEGTQIVHRVTGFDHRIDIQDISQTMRLTHMLPVTNDKTDIRCRTEKYTFLPT